MEKDCVEDCVFGARLLINLEADVGELFDNIRCARALLSEFHDMSITIRANVMEYMHKNPEYLIDGEVGDRKGIYREKGILEAFKRAVAQRCRIVVLDLDMNMSKRLLNPNQIAKYLAWRPDFKDEQIHTCYVVYHGKAVSINASVSDRQGIALILEKLKAEQ